MQRITSRQNPIVGRYRTAARGEAPGVMLLDGIHLVSEAVAAGLHLREAAVAAEAIDRDDVRPTIDHLKSSGVETFQVSAGVIGALSPVRSSSPIVALADRPDHSWTADLDRTPRQPSSGLAPFTLIAIDVQDPGNLGALVRVAEAGGATRVIVAGASADPFSWKALRGSMGSALRLPVLVTTDAAHAISAERAHGCRILATTPHGGDSVFDLDFTGAVAVLVGGEGPGLPKRVIDAADVCVTVPMEPPVESLNAAVTAAVVIYEARRQRKPRYERESAVAGERRAAKGSIGE
jgi:TrmH family RNA methyltransferase